MKKSALRHVERSLDALKTQETPTGAESPHPWQVGQVTIYLLFLLSNCLNENLTRIQYMNLVNGLAAQHKSPVGQQLRASNQFLEDHRLEIRPSVCSKYSNLLSNTNSFYCQDSYASFDVRAEVNSEEEGVIDIVSCEEEEVDVVSCEVTFVCNFFLAYPLYMSAYPAKFYRQMYGK